jgi:hypothetical protein
MFWSVCSTRLNVAAQTRFTTDDDSHVGDNYFLTSGDKIRYFFEEDAVGESKLQSRYAIPAEPEPRQGRKA